MLRNMHFTLPEGLELVAEFSEEDKWVKVEQVADAANTYRVLAGWKPNDPKADGRKQSAKLVVRRTADQQEMETTDRNLIYPGGKDAFLSAGVCCLGAFAE